MYTSSTFIRMSGPISEVTKKSTLTSDWENIAYWEEYQQNKVLANKFGLFQIQLGEGSGGLQRQENL